MLYTNLKLLRKAHACSSGMGTLIASLPKTQTEAKQISLAHILKSNGLEHAIWALRATTVDSRKYAAQMSADFASECLANFEKVYLDDKRPRFAVEAAGLFLDGKITLQELEIAESAAWDAARDAARDAAATQATRAAWAAAWATGVARAARSAESAMSAWSAAATQAAWATWAAAWATRSAGAANNKNEEIFLRWIRKAKP